jgi:hypothetical protein
MVIWKIQEDVSNAIIRTTRISLASSFAIAEPPLLPPFPHTNEVSSPGEASEGDGGQITTLVMGTPGEGAAWMTAGHSLRWRWAHLVRAMVASRRRMCE